jgi:hypothetical protein
MHSCLGAVTLGGSQFLAAEAVKAAALWQAQDKQDRRTPERRRAHFDSLAGEAKKPQA